MKKYYIIGAVILVVAIAGVSAWFLSAPYRANWASIKAREADFAEHNPALLKNLKDVNIKLEQIVKDNPGDMENWFQLGTNRKALGDLLGAKKALQIAAQLNKLSSTVMNNLGDVYQELGEYDKAEAAFLQMIERDKSISDGYIKLSQFYLATKYKPSEEAEKVLFEGLNAPVIDSGAIILALAEFYDETGQTEKALEYYKKVEEIQKNLDKSNLPGGIRLK
jgi:tetratricopeptide (TPR) repeat protein